MPTADLCDPFGPEYNVGSPSIEKYRRKVRQGGLKALSPDERHAYGEAVEQAVLKSQRGARGEVLHRAPCASGTWHSDGRDISAAIRRQQAAALAAAPGQIRRARTDDQWRQMYEAAMAEKRERERA